MSLDLLPVNNPNKVLTVEQLNTQIRSLIEGQLGVVWIQGEISNFKPHSSGHFYFSLKDAKSQISAIMFRGHNSKLKFKPQDGLEVIVRGRVTVYEPRGNYQIACDLMEPVGAGALQKQFEQLKEKLKAEGLFESSRKKSIPAYPRSVAIVTSPTGAAIQDILNIMKRRAQGVHITVVPSIVQGAAAAPQLCEAFKNAIRLNPDVIIIGRGGGSIEDMWCFNDESLARLIASSHIPVISAVGHEIDFTICDFVSDLRAPTPSAAAELVSKSSNETSLRLTQLSQNVTSYLNKNLNLKKQNLTHLSKRLKDPKKTLQDFALKNDDLFDRLELAMKNYIAGLSKDTILLRNKLVTPTQALNQYKSYLEQRNIKLKNAIETKIKERKFRFQNYSSLLDSLSPLKVVDRGYSIVKYKDQVIKSIKQIKKDQDINIKVQDGVIVAKVTHTIESEG